MNLFCSRWFTAVCSLRSAGALLLLLSFAPVAAGAPTPLAEEVKPLQGHWEGEGAGGKCSITIEGNSLHYRNSAGWYKTTFTLPAGAEPRQLHATIKECSPPSTDAIGTIVFAIFKIEDGTLLLATYDGSDKPPTTFDGASNRYTVKKVQSPKNRPDHPHTIPATPFGGVQ